MLQSTSQAVRFFGELSRELEEFNRATEKEFLEIGETLQQLSARTGQIARRSGAMAEQMQGQEFSRAMEDLETVLGQVERAESDARSSRETLADMLTHLQASRKPLAGFGNLVRTLNILGLYTQIENARLGRADFDLGGMAEDVKRLAAQIEERSETILERGKELAGHLQETLRHLDELLTMQRAEVAVLIREGGGSLKSLGDCRARGAASAAHMSSYYQEVCRKMAEIVRSLQFQDLTRQQIEHVGEALAEVRTKLQATDPDPESLRFAATVMRLQEAQLRHSQDALVAAVNRILENLRAIAQQTVEVCADTRRLVRAAEQEGTSLLGGIEQHLSVVAGTLGTYCRSSLRVSRTVTSAMPEIRNMAQAANQIEGVGFAMTMVALNAQIKTSQVGAQAAALGVLAEKIREITAEAPERIGGVVSHLRRLTQGAQELSSRLGSETDAALSERDVLAAGLLSCTEKIGETRERIETEWTGIEDAVASLATDLEKACAAIQVHIRAGEVFGRLLADLESTRLQLTPDGFQPSEETLVLRQDRYTMQAERAVHADITGLAEMAESGPSQEPSDPPQENPDPDGLGDNVELF